VYHSPAWVYFSTPGSVVNLAQSEAGQPAPVLTADGCSVYFSAPGSVKTVFPHHHRLQPQPGGLFRPADLQAELERMGVNVNFINPTPLQPYVLTK
jgi:hypothetical protein